VPETQSQKNATGPKEKIWFWRRAFAFAIDSILAQIIIVIAVLLIWGGKSDTVRLASSLIAKTNCQQIATDGPARPAADLNMPGRKWNAAFSCEIRNFDILEHRFVRHIEQTQVGNATYRYFTDVPVTEAGQPVNVWLADDIAFVLILFGTAFFQMSRLQATPGMKFLSINLQNFDGSRPRWKSITYRIAIVMAAIIAIVLGFVISIYFQILNLFTILTFMLLVFAGTLFWWRPDLIAPVPRAPVHDLIANTRIRHVDNSRNSIATG
jgi:uncharacterized RDD family membrane protein YckC